MIDALIIAPEITKGMKSIGSKILLQVKKHKCVLDYQIESISRISKNIRITVATGFESEKIIELLSSNYKSSIRHIHDFGFKYTNQAESVRLYFEKYPDTTELFIVLSGIIFKDQSITDEMLQGQSKIFILNKNKENFTLGCVDATEPEYIFYDLPYCWSECIYFNTVATQWLKEFVQNNNTSQMYLFELINEALAHKIIIHNAPINKKNIIKVSGPKDISKAKLFV